MGTKANATIDRGRFRVVVVPDGAVQLAGALNDLNEAGYNVLAILNNHVGRSFFVVGNKPSAINLFDSEENITPGIEH